ncbi:hypothetical protein [Kitasatospora sp. SUK 42]|uniref:MmyB family transcriptional regulator n=1 Tax=Kitasatospora sp. SUK 42 TaxID=1588882 RepID=UPI0018C92B44|nr:hypothetical protein [Kitasatospora sp. SUK 42]MBV2152760.1 hypothetical protein [Kitasatospora sp. SUK 42]
MSTPRSRDEVAAATAAQLRLVRARHPADGELARLIDDLAAAGRSFRTHWAAGDVELRAAGDKNLRHPDAGVLALHYENFDLPGDPGQRIVALSPAQDPATETALRHLAASARTAQPPQPASRRSQDGSDGRQGPETRNRY